MPLHLRHHACSFFRFRVSSRALSTFSRKARIKASCAAFCSLTFSTVEASFAALRPPFVRTSFAVPPGECTTSRNTKYPPPATSASNAGKTTNRARRRGACHFWGAIGSVGVSMALSAVSPRSITPNGDPQYRQFSRVERFLWPHFPQVTFAMLGFFRRSGSNPGARSCRGGNSNTCPHRVNPQDAPMVAVTTSSGPAAPSMS